jgi:uncharacterized protein
MTRSRVERNRIAAETPWYDLFSRGARDWLRHNEKVREAVQGNLSDLMSGPDVITGPSDRTVQVPVRLLEHARFRLSDSEPRSGAGQGQGEPGDLLHPAPDLGQDSGSDEGQGGHQDGEVQLLLEFKIDDIIDWLWEEMKLPDLQPKSRTSMQEQELVREGWDKRGARSRLDRRRTVKEAIKRRAIQENPVPFTNEDLRFRQLVMRRKPAMNAAVIFALDVSASMNEAERKLAKTFFFFALEGIRRKYGKVETRFIAHTTRAWEFPESEFFQVAGSGGTLSSTAFNLALEMVQQEYDPAHYNSYLFYASDGENFMEDRVAAGQSLGKLAELMNYIGYVETVPGMPHHIDTEMKRICNGLERNGARLGSCLLTRTDDVWKAIRLFFGQQSKLTEDVS